MSTAFISSLRYWFLLLSVVLAFLGLMGRLVYLQAIKHDEYSQIAFGNRKSTLTLTARRGNIVDCRGNALAITQPRIELGADPQLIEEEDFENVGRVAILIGADPQTVLEKVRRKTRTVETENGRKLRQIRWVKLAESIDEATYQKIRELEVPVSTEIVSIQECTQVVIWGRMY